MSGIGSEYFPRLDLLKRYKRVMFIENESDRKILSILAEKCNMSFSTDIVFWPNTDKHDTRRHLFDELKKIIPNLKGISIRDRDMDEPDIVGNGLVYKGILLPSDSDLKLLEWRRKNIESYLLCPKAIALACGRKTEEIIQYFSDKHALSISEDGFVEEEPPQAIKYLDGKEENIKVSNIVSKIKEDKVECFVNISEGREDFIILSKKKKFTIYNEKFVDVFIERLNNCVAVREMMWYSINDIPNSMKKKIFKKYFETGCSEASWLVRRAMGSTLSSLDGDEEDNIVNKFLDSFNWMDKCIGIVAISKSISEERAKYLKNILCDKNSSIDLIWLADLYLSDSEYYDIEITLKSKLSKSVWGLIEIWDRYVEKHIKQNELFEIIKQHIDNSGNLQGLIREIELREKPESGTLTSFLYQGKKRGRTVELKKKWLLSLLYGNWRGRVECDLKEYFLNNKKEKIIKELESAKDIPSVERRVSIFEYFENEQEYFEKYKEYIKWGLQDEHPWVRRIAILCFRNYPKEIETSFQDMIKTEFYSETFAMIINAASITLDNYQEYIECYQWTDSEKSAISKAVFRENKRKYM